MSAAPLSMVNFPFYGHSGVMDGLRCVFVIDPGQVGGEGVKARRATVFLYSRLTTVKVDAAMLATKAKAVKFQPAVTREFIAKLAACYRRSGLGMDRETTTFVLLSLGVSQRRIRQEIEKVQPVVAKVERQDHELLTPSEARQIDREQTKFFRALGLPLKSDTPKFRVMADARQIRAGLAQYQMPF